MSAKDRGRFISLEGGEGVGKSTQLGALSRALRECGIDVVETREPGGSEGAEAIRKLLLQGDERRWSIEAEALLFAAARADHVEKTILPALERGEWVLSDRFVDSSLAYQGEAGGIGSERIRELHAIGSRGFLPDRTLVLSLAEGQERAKARDRDTVDRIGGRPEDFHQKVELAFRTIAAEEPGRVQLIDASGSEDEVTRRLLDSISDLLP
ncbi:MAG TPA: dTMP kinase [Sphingomicrobium sp.]|nr:dTMP kinase [Sphingomicrobium sp.]